MRMKKKINLTIEPELIELAKKISAKKKVSISRLFELWLESYKKDEAGEHWLDDFRHKYKDKMNQFTDEEQERAKQDRGRKWD